MSTYRNSKLNLQDGCSTLPYMAKVPLPAWDKIEVGRRIVLLRAAKGGMEQYVLADRIGITPQKLANYEKGRHMLPPDKAQQLSIATGANFDYIYRGLKGSLPGDLAAAIQEAEKAPPKKVARRA
jgi:transcriptional regulator with XRE-family HTH domain